MAKPYEIIVALFSKAHFNTNRLTEHGVQLLVDLDLVNFPAQKVTCIGARSSKNGKRCCNRITEKMLPGIVVNLYSMAGDRTITDDQLHGHTMTFIEHLLCPYHADENNKRRVADGFLPVYLQYREEHLISSSPTPPSTIGTVVTPNVPDAVAQDVTATIQQLLQKNESLEWDLQQAISTIHSQQSTIAHQQNTLGEQQSTIGEQQRTIGEQHGNISAQQEEIKKLLRRLRQLRFNSSF